MTASSQAERRLIDWLSGQADSTGADRVLHDALTRVAGAGQERYVTQRLFGDEVGRSYRLRTALAIAVLAVARLGAVVVGAALLRRVPPPPEPPPVASNGLIAFSANGEAGDHLEGTTVSRSGDQDIYVVDAGLAPRRIVGTGVDGWHQMCPAFLAGGRQLAYLELEISSLARSQVPVPAGETPPPPPPTPTSQTPIWAIVVVEFDEGNPGAQLARVVVEASSMSCPTWASNGRQFAYTAPVGSIFWISTLDGSREQLLANGAYDIGAIDLSPDGTTLAIADVTGQRVGLLPVDGGETTWIAAPDVSSVAWSPNGRQIAAGAGRDDRNLRRSWLQHCNPPARFRRRPGACAIVVARRAVAGVV